MALQALYQGLLNDQRHTFNTSNTLFYMNLNSTFSFHHLATANATAPEPCVACTVLVQQQHDSGLKLGEQLQPKFVRVSLMAVGIVVRRLHQHGIPRAEFVLIRQIQFSAVIRIAAGSVQPMVLQL